MKLWTVIVSILLSFTSAYAIEVGNGTDIANDDLARLNGPGFVVPNPSITTYPWIVAIMRVTTPPGAFVYYAVGSAVSQRWVLTSGQVATYVKNNVATDLIEVIFGSADISATCGTSCQTRKIKLGLPHPTFVGTTVVNNIGLVKVCPTFPTTMTFATIPATPVNIVATNTGTSLGWQGSQTALRALVQTVEVDSTCSTSLSAAFAASNPWETTNICMAVAGRGTCTTDRGGPFVMNSQVVAVLDVSGCNTVNTDTYTKLDATFISWINTNKIIP